MLITALVPSCADLVYSKDEMRSFSWSFPGFSWKVLTALFFTPETSVLSHGFSMIYVAIHSYSLILRLQRPKKALC
jgi:hypothetical protein